MVTSADDIRVLRHRSDTIEITPTITVRMAITIRQQSARSIKNLDCRLPSRRLPGRPAWDFTVAPLRTLLQAFHDHRSPGRTPSQPPTDCPSAAPAAPGGSRPCCPPHHGKLIGCLAVRSPRAPEPASRPGAFRPSPHPCVLAGRSTLPGIRKQRRPLAPCRFHVHCGPPGERSR